MNKNSLEEFYTRTDSGEVTNIVQTRSGSYGCIGCNFIISLLIDDSLHDYVDRDVVKKLMNDVGLDIKYIFYFDLNEIKIQCSLVNSKHRTKRSSLLFLYHKLQEYLRRDLSIVVSFSTVRIQLLNADVMRKWVKERSISDEPAITICDSMSSDDERLLSGGAIYLFANPHDEQRGEFKIGLVNRDDIKTLKSRLSGLTCSNTDGVFIEVWKNIKDVGAVEKNIHDLLRKVGKHYKKEWFTFVNREDAIKTITYIIRSMGCVVEVVEEIKELDEEEVMVEDEREIEEVAMVTTCSTRFNIFGLWYRSYLSYKYAGIKYFKKNIYYPILRF